MAWTKQAPLSVFFTRNDIEDPRLGEWAIPLAIDADSSELSEKIPHSKTTAAPTSASSTSINSAAIQSPLPWTLLGYPDDEGIAMNGGRLGAKEAPDRIRTFFYKMTPSLLSPTARKIFDLGNVLGDIPLPERHQRGRKIIHSAMQNGCRTLSLGGGHDYGYADGAGFLDYALSLNERPVLINFDAHLDVRPSDKGFHSGTSFNRLLTDYAGKFDFVEVGLHNQCNSSAHLKWAQGQGAKIALLEDIRSVGLLTLLQSLLTPLAGRMCFVSVDIDAFNLSEAPGCSQSWTSGLNHQEFAPALGFLLDSMKVMGVGIYEVSPPLDIDNHTSKLATLILHQTIFHH